MNVTANGTAGTVQGTGRNRFPLYTYDVLTSGQVARACRVAPRTAAKWMDDGRIKGYRIPGSRDRRMLRVDVLAFLKRADMPISPELNRRILWVGCSAEEVDGSESLTAADAFAAGILIGQGPVAVVVVDAAGIGTGAALELGKQLAALQPRPRLIGRRTEDDSGTHAGWSLFDAVLPAGADVGDLLG